MVLDTHLTPELVEEGFVREIISKVQTMRKEAGFEVTDRIALSLKDNSRLEEVAQKNQETILSEVMATTLSLGETSGYEKTWSINGETVVIGVKKQ